MAMKEDEMKKLGSIVLDMLASHDRSREMALKGLQDAGKCVHDIMCAAPTSNSFDRS